MAHLALQLNSMYLKRPYTALPQVSRPRKLAGSVTLLCRLTCTVTSKVSSPWQGSAVTAGGPVLQTPPPAAAALSLPFDSGVAAATAGPAGDCKAEAVEPLLLAHVAALLLNEPVGSCTRIAGPADGFVLICGIVGG